MTGMPAVQSGESQILGVQIERASAGHLSHRDLMEAQFATNPVLSSLPLEKILVASECSKNDWIR